MKESESEKDRCPKCGTEKGRCPKCGGIMRRTEGCVKCPSCGYSRC